MFLLLIRSTQNQSKRVLSVFNLFWNYWSKWRQILDGSLKSLWFWWSEVHKRNKRPKGVRRVFSIFVCGAFIFQSIFLHVPYKNLFTLYGLQIVYDSYRFQDIRWSKFGFVCSYKFLWKIPVRSMATYSL